MAEVSIDLNMVRVSNEEFLKKAADCAPQLKELWYARLKLWISVRLTVYIRRCFTEILWIT